MAVEPLRVEGLTELITGFRLADRGLGNEVAAAIRESGEVVRVDAQGRAVRSIRNIGEVWPRMRLGGGQTEVYIVPRTRRSKASRRPNLGKLLVDRAMEPALAENIHRVEHDLQEALENLHQNAGLIRSLHNLVGE